MGTFTVRLQVAAAVDAVWAALVDWPAHGRWVPLTTVRVTSAGAGGVGATFVARTGLGRLAFDDRMTVTVWEPPTPSRAGRCAVRKSGRVVHGGAELVVRALDADRSEVVWTETADVAGLRRLPLVGLVDARVGAFVFGRAMRRMARAVEHQQGPRA